MVQVGKRRSLASASWLAAIGSAYALAGFQVGHARAEEGGQLAAVASVAAAGTVTAEMATIPGKVKVRDRR